MTREEERQSLLNKQVETLRLHGISVEEVKPRLMLVIVSRANLETALSYQISPDISIACRA